MLIPLLLTLGVSIPVSEAVVPEPPNRAAAVAHVKSRARNEEFFRGDFARDPSRHPHGPWCPTDHGFVDWLAARAVTPVDHFARPKVVNVSLVDGVVVMEDDGTLTRNDRPVDLEGQALLFSPGADGFDVRRVPLAYEDDIGAELFAGQDEWIASPVDLTTFAFPFGGVDRTSVFVTPSMELAFEMPEAPEGDQLLSGDVLFDRSPRIAAVQQAARFDGRNAFFREDVDRAVFTWRRDAMDLQVVLFHEGSILMNYRAIGGLRHGSPVVVTGNDEWWSDVTAVGSTADAVGEIGVPGPDGAAVDMVELRAFQVAGTELLVLELVLAGLPPTDTELPLQYSVQLRDEPGEDAFRTVNAEWAEGAWNWRDGPIEVDGNIVRYHFLKSELPLLDDDIEFLAWTGRDWEWLDPVVLEASWTDVPVAPLVTDFSSIGRLHSHGPLFESFTLPDLIVSEVYRAFNDRFGSPRIDGLAIYQTFPTDIQFYAGAYSTVGNPGADGIGNRSRASEPAAPALLHMNQVRYGWNANDDGKVTVLNHEFGHHWLYFINIIEEGTPSDILNPLGGHPAAWCALPAAAPVESVNDSSCMGGATWADNGDGTFTTPDEWTVRGFHWHELYLMGLADASEVPDWYYIRDPDPEVPQAYWAPQNITVTGERVNVSIDQLIAHEGPRFPTAADSRKDFLVPMVLVTRPGELRDEDVQEVADTCALWADKFGVSTMGRATMTCDRVGLRPPEARIVDPPTTVFVSAGDTVSFLGDFEDPDEESVTLTWSFAGIEPDTIGAGTHDIVFPRAGVYTIQLDAEDEAGLTDATPPTVDVVVACRAPEEVQDLRVSWTEAGDLHFTWSDLPQAPDEYLIVESIPFGSVEVVSGPVTGVEGLELSPPRGVLNLFKVAARNLPDCVGP
ncbi:MAG: PKD domain-containing protein [Acidobacteriota bacterium]